MPSDWGLEAQVATYAKHMAPLVYVRQESFKADSLSYLQAFSLFLSACLLSLLSVFFLLHAPFFQKFKGS